MPILNDDAASLLAFAQSQQTIIERETFSEARDMADIVYPQFVPVVGGDDTAESITYVSSKRAGQAEFINANADDVPMADAQMDVESKSIYTAAIGYGWAWQELQRAQALGYNMRGDKAFAARRAYEELVQTLVFEGDSKRSMKGLNSAPNATKVTTGFTGDWVTSTATAQEIARDVITLMRGTGRGTQPTANRLVLPESEYTYALTTFFANTGRTALDLIRDQYPGLQIASRTALENISAKNRYLAYRNDSTSLAFYLPMPLQFRPVYQSGPLRFEVPGLFRVGGLNVKRKEDFAYAEGA